LFTGLTKDAKPCLAYLVTGRSPESRDRRAIQVGNKVAVGPLGAVEYDPLRHYTAVQYDDATGVCAVTNGIQTEAIFETYRLLYNVKSTPTIEYLEKTMDGAEAEPDSLRTPRIGAIITSHSGAPVSFVSIKRHDGPAKAFRVMMEPGKLEGVATYSGSLEDPQPFDPTPGVPKLDLQATSAKDIAQFLFDISAATNKGQDIRVCTVGGVLGGGGWELSVINAH
jgi:IMP cyclohydrolase